MRENDKLSAIGIHLKNIEKKVKTMTIDTYTFLIDQKG